MFQLTQCRYEAKLKEFERSRVIYKYALDRLPRSRSQQLHKSYTTFEKQFGEREGVEEVILSKRRVQYEEQIKENPKNYDVWFDYARLEETLGDRDRVRDVYERAIANIPPTKEKRHWRRYIYLWVFYALWEEMEGKVRRFLPPVVSWPSRQFAKPSRVQHVTFKHNDINIALRTSTAPAKSTTNA